MDPAVGVEGSSMDPKDCTLKKLSIKLSLVFAHYCVVHRKTIPKERQFIVVNLFYNLHVKLSREATKTDFKVCGSEKEIHLCPAY